MSLVDVVAHRDGTLFPAANTGRLVAALKRSRRELGADLPEEYVDFLQRSNGAMVDGLILYPTEPLWVDGAEVPGLIDINLRRRVDRPGLGDILVLGEVDDDFIVYRLADKGYWRIDRLSLDPCETAASLEELVKDLVNAGNAAEF